MRSQLSFLLSPFSFLLSPFSFLSEPSILTSLFFGTAFANILTPGPNMMYVATRGAERGVGGGLRAAAAIVMGGVFYSVTTALGLSAVMATIPALIVAIKAVGICYLLYLGVRLLIRARDRTPPAVVAPATGPIIRDGFLISITNPQLALFFLAFLPQFVVPGERPIWVQLLTLGLTFNCCTLAVMTVVGTVSGHAGNRVANITFRQVMRALAGCGFLALAVKSAVSLLK